MNAATRKIDRLQRDIGPFTRKADYEPIYRWTVQVDRELDPIIGPSGPPIGWRKKQPEDDGG